MLDSLLVIQWYQLLKCGKILRHCVETGENLENPQSMVGSEMHLPLCQIACSESLFTINFLCRCKTCEKIKYPLSCMVMKHGPLIQGKNINKYLGLG